MLSQNRASLLSYTTPYRTNYTTCSSQEVPFDSRLCICLVLAYTNLVAKMESIFLVSIDLVFFLPPSYLFLYRFACFSCIGVFHLKSRYHLLSIQTMTVSSNKPSCLDYDQPYSSSKLSTWLSKV